MTPPFLSIIVPVWREEKRINPLLNHLYTSFDPSLLEVIVVDGHPQQTTLEAVKRKGPLLLTSPPGRAVQMNKGARQSRGEVLLFLHVDTYLPRNALGQIQKALRASHILGGAFDLSLDSDRLIYRLVEKVSSLRSRFTRIPYGDQALFLRRSVFEALGGYREIPIMEDVELMKRVKKVPGKIAFLTPPVRTSARRWEKEGILYCTARNWLMSTLYFLGVSPKRLASLYPSDSK